jgi:preprotein translocase subunit SecA
LFFLTRLHPPTPPHPPQAIKFLQQAVGLRGYAARDPLTEFKLEGYNLFLETTAQVGGQGSPNAVRAQSRQTVGAQQGARSPLPLLPSVSAAQPGATRPTRPASNLVRPCPPARPQHPSRSAAT